MKLLGQLSKLHPLVKMDRCGFELESDWCIRDKAKLFYTLWDSRGLTYGRCVAALIILYRYDSLQLYSWLTSRSATISGMITMTRHDGAVPTQFAPRKQNFTVTHDRIHHTILEHLARAKTVWLSREMWDGDISKSILFADVLTSVNR